MCVCVCVCACARAHARKRQRECVCPRAWDCACARVHVALLIEYASRMRHIVTSFVALQAPPYFLTSHKRSHFRKKVKNMKYVLSKTFLILRRIERVIVINVKTSSNIKFYQNPSSGSPIIACGRTDEHDEANSHISQIFERAQKYLYKHSERVKCMPQQCTEKRVSLQILRNMDAFKIFSTLIIDSAV